MNQGKKTTYDSISVNPRRLRILPQLLQVRPSVFPFFPFSLSFLFSFPYLLFSSLFPLLFPRYAASLGLYRPAGHGCESSTRGSDRHVASFWCWTRLSWSSYCHIFPYFGNGFSDDMAQSLWLVFNEGLLQKANYFRVEVCIFGDLLCRDKLWRSSCHL